MNYELVFSSLLRTAAGKDKADDPAECFNCSKKTLGESKAVIIREKAKKGGAIDVTASRPMIRRWKLLVG